MGYTHKNSKGVTYHLNCKDVTLRNGTNRTIYYFSKDERDTKCDLPKDMVVKENPRNGFLTLAKKK